MISVMRPALCLAVLAGTSTAQAQPTQIDPTPPAFVVEQQNMLEQIDPVWGGPGQDAHLARPAHPPLHLIPPMPAPDPSEDVLPNMGPGVPLSYDIASGTVTQEPLYPSLGATSGERAGFRSGFGEEDFSDGSVLNESFISMFQINNVGDDPWRRNVKLVMRFEDQNGIDRFFVASGSMADAETVLTAGHCVYARSPNGINIFDWAREIWVYPGWDGNGITADNAQIIQTHGIGYSSGLGAFTGWTQNGNFDWDMGLVRINRGVGLLTGWYGWAWGFDCSTIQGRTYNNPGYPAENCSGSLHNGRDMYQWGGSIDSCPGNQMQIDTTPGCFTAMWGGQSGSAAYYLDDNSNRLAHGVASNSNRSTRGRYAKMWESFKDYMIDFENDSRGSALDVQLLRARYDESVVTAGQTIGGNGYVIANPTNNNPPSQVYNLSHRLSTNQIISTFDTVLANTFISSDLAAVSANTANNFSSTYTIPKNTPSGTYYVGVVLDIADANTSNNAGSYWDAHRLTVNGVADISADSITTGSSSVLRGETITVNIDYSNLGGDPSNTIVADFRLSNNDFISTGDISLGTTNYSGQAGDSSNSRNRSVNIPIVAPGTYWLGVILSASDDVDSSNNWVASVPITINARYCADQNGDGLVSPADFSAWITNFNNGDPRADTNGDGLISPADFSAWIAAFNQGTSGPFCTP